MKFDRSNKFDFCYYGQVNSLRLKSSVASKRASKHLWGVPFILLAMVPTEGKVFAWRGESANATDTWNIQIIQSIDAVMKRFLLLAA